MCTLPIFSVVKSTLFIRALLLDRIVATEKIRVRLAYILLVSVNIACFVTNYTSILESTDNLSDHEPLFCYLDCCIDDLPPNIDDSCTLNKKPLWHSAKDSDIEAYIGTLNRRVSRNS